MDTGIGKRLTDVLEVLKNEQNVTQGMLSEQLDVTDNTVRRWKLEETYPPLDKVQLLLEKANVNPMYLITGQPPMFLVASKMLNEAQVPYRVGGSAEVHEEIRTRDERIIKLQEQLINCQEKLNGLKT